MSQTDPLQSESYAAGTPAPLNLCDPALLADPYPVYAEMRRNHPVRQIEPGGIWAVSRYADVVTVIKDHQRFSSEGFRAVFTPPWLNEKVPLADSMLMMDPPQHTRLRALVNRAFGPRGIARLEPYIRTAAENLADRLRDCKEGDFVAEFALPFPGMVISEVLGLDPSLHGNFKRWVGDLVSIPPEEPSRERAEQIRTSIRQMRHHAAESIAARRNMLTDDIVSDLIRTEVDGQKLTEDELMGFVFVLITGGFETTIHLLTGAIRLLFDRPDDWRRLRADHALIPGFIEEVLRFDSPVRGLLRIAREDVVLSGVKIPAGAFVLAMLASANRDERQFRDADRFDMERNAQSVALGYGPHFCLGASLARMEGRIGMEALLKRFARFERAPGVVEWPPSLTVRGPENLPVRPIPA